MAANYVDGGNRAHSGSVIPGDSDTSEMSIPDIVRNGTLMTKISEKKKKDTIFRLDPEEGCILYKSRKGGIVPIEAIKELRTGTDTRYYRAQYKFPEEFEERWITIIYILDGNYKTLHMIAATRDVFAIWDVTLRKHFTIRQGLMTGLGNTEIRENVWERQYWKGADEEGDQVLDFDDVERLCFRLNINLTPSQLRTIFDKVDVNKKGHLDYPAYQRFVKILKRRPEIEVIYGKICSSPGVLDLNAFKTFMHDIQKSTLNDSELQNLFMKYATSASDEQGKDHVLNMTLDNFQSYLKSSENSAFSEQNRPIWQEMIHPISEYYISSSHNTYLVGHQLVGVSTIEGYIRALLHSCRSVELDIYDGDQEPMIYHGNTLTSKVSLRDICEAVAKYAFVTSPYPVIISAEVHCGVAQQDKIVDIMTQVFGSSLVQAPVEGRPKITELPSPESLRNKILLKAKNLYVVEQLASVQAKRSLERAQVQEKADVDKSVPKSVSPPTTSTSASSSITSDSDTGLDEEIKDLKSKWRKMRGKDTSGAPTKPKVKMSFRLASLLVYTVGVKCHGIHPDIQYAPEHIFSLSESSANKLLKASMKDLVKHNQTHLVRIYPKGTRVNSTNYEPHRYWAAGAQVVAINWQTFDFGYMINQSMFQRNGRAGYVLKPEALRLNNERNLSKRTQHFLDVTIISAQQLPRPKDSRGQEILGKSIVDPFVEVTLHIPDWSNSPFLPDSAKAAGAKYTPTSEATATTATSARKLSCYTKIVKNDGFNPLWQEELSLPFDCVGGMIDLIFVTFSVRQEGKGDDDEPIAIYCTPLGCLQKGYRHLPLHDTQLSQYLFSTLFVKVGIRQAN